jgi:hypothetical protein
MSLVNGSMQQISAISYGTACGADAMKSKNATIGYPSRMEAFVLNVTLQNPLSQGFVTSVAAERYRGIMSVMHASDFGINNEPISCLWS